MTEVPNPGSDEAVEQGCWCAVLDNSHGLGCGTDPKTGETRFWITQGCPLHNHLYDEIVSAMENND